MSSLVDELWFPPAGRERRLSFVGDDGAEEQLSWGELRERALRAASGLRAASVVQGETVFLLLPTSSAFVASLFGAFLMGAVPCALPPPLGFGDAGAFVARLRDLAADLGARRAVTDPSLKDLVAEAGLEPLLGEALVRHDLPAGALPTLDPTRPALIQCTSSSTGPPKGVLLGQAELSAQVDQIGDRVAVRPEDVDVCWLPLFHDMGLVGCLLFSARHGLEAWFMSPARFLRRPASWLQLMSRARGSISPAPNFAFAFATARAKEAELEGLDLSPWRVAACGAEPIDAGVLERFAARFGPLGFKARAFAPCYGLAESTLGVTFHPPGVPYAVDKLDRAALARGEVVDTADPGGARVVSCGPPFRGTEVRIVDEHGAPLPEGRVGRILARGPAIMRGYRDRPGDTEAAFLGGWLVTGDLGYLRGGELRITGREKDVVIIRGRNHSPSEFEWAADEVEGVRRGASVAFGVRDEEQGTEALTLVCETELEDEAARAGLVAAIRARVAERTGVAPTIVELVPRGTVPKTSSGKLQRGKLRLAYLAGRSFG